MPAPPLATFERQLDRYAEILVRHAVGLRPGQDVFIRGPEIQRDFGLRVGRAAYEHCARSVNYRFPNGEELRQLLSIGGFGHLSLHQEKEREYFAEILKRNVAFICLANDFEARSGWKKPGSRIR